MCGYFVAYYWNVMWLDAMVFFPLVILGIERTINEYKPLLYIGALALTLFTNYYMGYMTCIFSVLYFIVYYLACHDISDVEADTPFTFTESGKKKYRPADRLLHSRLLKSGLSFAFASFTAACIVGFSLVPVYFILKNCSATSGTFPEDWSSYFSIYDFLSNHIASVDPTIRSSGEDVLPNIYCGMATLILFPLYLFSKKIEIKEKAAYIGLLAVIFFSFSMNKFNYIWHGFHFPNDLPYRFSFMYSFVLLLIAYKAFTHLREFTGREILGIGMAIIAAIIIFQEFGAKNVEDLSVFISIAFVITYCLVFVITKNESYQRSAVAVLLLCCVIGEIACANTGRYSMSQTKTSYASDYKDFVALKSELDKHDGSDDYRMDLTYNRARMDPSWYGYNGVSTFTSMAYEKVANLESDLGLYGNYINSYTYYLQTPVYNMMHSLKYIVDNNTEVDVSDDYYTKLMTKGVFTAYENKYCLPIAYTVNDSITDWYTDVTNPFTVQNDYIELATGVEDVFTMMNIDEIRYFNVDEITSGLATGDLYFSKTVSGSDGELTFILKTDEVKHCYLFVESASFDSIDISKNGEVYTQSIDEPYIYDLGVCTPEDSISVLASMGTDKNYGYINFYPYAINNDAFTKAYNILNSGAMNVTSFNDTQITGTVKSAGNSILYTSIPYDKGWSVKVDGKKVSPEDTVIIGDAFLAIKLKDGEHSVEFEFVPQGLVAGVCISAFGLMFLLLWMLVCKRLQVQKQINMILRQADAAKAQGIDDSLSAPDEIDFTADCDGNKPQDEEHEQEADGTAQSTSTDTVEEALPDETDSEE